MKHAEALILAEEALNALKPSCERILIAGSIRRQVRCGTSSWCVSHVRFLLAYSAMCWS